MNCRLKVDDTNETIWYLCATSLILDLRLERRCLERVVYSIYLKTFITLHRIKGVRISFLWSSNRSNSVICEPRGSKCVKKSWKLERNFESEFLPFLHWNFEFLNNRWLQFIYKSFPSSVPGQLGRRWSLEL